MIMNKYLLIIIIILNAISAEALTSSQQADSAYNKEDFSTAVRLYRKSIDNEGVSSNIYYNLGNAYYRIGDLGRAVISYERALKIDPSNENARINLAFVNTRITDKPEDDSSFLGNLHRKIISAATPNVWAWIAFALFVALLGAVALYIFPGKIVIRKTGFFGGMVILFVWIYALVIAYQSAAAFDDHETAVVVVPTTNLSSSPGSQKKSNDKVVPIHEGTRVEIVDSMETPDDPSAKMWYDVKINNSTRAWLRATDVERI